MNIKTFFSANIFLSWLAVLIFASCAKHAALQNSEERMILKAPLAQGERIIRANSCSKVDRADFLGGGSAVFGSLYLTNLRLIYEESEWARTLAAIGKAIPTQGDFGIKHILKGAYEILNANYVIELGNNGKLSVVVRTGQIIIPLPEIKSMVLSGSRFSSETPADIEKSRWVTIITKDGNQFVFEIYTLPPDKTAVIAEYDSGQWKKEIMKARSLSFK